MSKQTAVEWLENEMPVINWSDPYWKVMLDKAKAMEKKQIQDALDVGYQIANEDVRFKHIQTTEQYYNETYKGGDK
jgi:hypothetical protein